MKALNPSQRREVYRLDKPYKLRYEREWADAERQRDRGRKAKKPRILKAREQSPPPTDPWQAWSLEGLNEKQRRRLRARWQREEKRNPRVAVKQADQRECDVELRMT